MINHVGPLYGVPKHIRKAALWALLWDVQMNLMLRPPLNIQDYHRPMVGCFHKEMVQLPHVALSYNFSILSMQLNLCIHPNEGMDFYSQELVSHL